MFRLLTGEYPFGEAMMVPVNIQNQKRAPWPDFMENKEQFAPLSRSLKEIVEACLEYDKAKRITFVYYALNSVSHPTNFPVASEVDFPRNLAAVKRTVTATVSPTPSCRPGY